MTASAGALVPQVGDRPAVIKFNGGWVYLGVHDATYLRERSAWKAKVAQAHPDKGGTRTRFVHVYKQYRSWRRDAHAWYATFGLLPPEYSAPRRNLLRAIERDVIQDVVRTTRSVNQAASVLGIHYDTLRSKMRRYAIPWRTPVEEI